MNSAVYFPIAGCASCQNRMAVDYHHRWSIVDAQGVGVTADQFPALQQVTTDIRMGDLIIRAPGMLRMDIPLDVIEDDDSVKRTVTINGKIVHVVDEGDVAAAWFENVTGAACRLVKRLD